MKKKCVKCGALFETDISRYYCEKCTPKEIKYYNKKCRVCSKPFKSDNKRRLFCSVECQKIGKKQADQAGYINRYKEAECELTPDTEIVPGKNYWYRDKSGNKVHVPKRLITALGQGKPFRFSELNEFSLDIIIDYTPSLGKCSKEFMAKMFDDLDIDYM